MANNNLKDDWQDLPVDSTDDWEEVPLAAAAPEVSKLESAGRGAAQGASLGFADEIVGGAKALWDVATTDAELLDMRALYPQYRDEYRQADGTAQQANPITYGASNVAGGAATMLIPGLNVAKGATAANAAAKGMAIGGVTGLGATEKEGYGALSDAAMGASIGGLAGGASQGLINKLSGGQQRTADLLQDLANVRSAKAMGADKGTITKLGIDRVKQLGNEGLKSKIVTPLAGTDEMLGRAEALKSLGGSKMGQAFDTIDNAGASNFNATDVANKVDESLGGFYRSPINKGETQQLNNMLESITMRGADNIPLKEAQALKQEIGKVAYPSGKNINPDMISEKQRMAQEAYKIINQAIDKSASEAGEALGDPGLKALLSEGKQSYGTGANAAKLLANKQAKEAGNKMFGLTDTIAGSAGLGAAIPTGGTSAVVSAGFVLGKKVLEKYGNQTTAVGAHKLADIVRSAPQALGKYSAILTQAAARGGSSLSATHYLLQQRDPEYRELSKKALGDGQDPEM